MGGSPCGGGGPRCGLLRGCNLRLRNPFRRDVVVTDPCGEPALGIPVETAPAVIPGAVIPAPAAPAAPAEEIPSLEPAPTSSTAAPATGQASPNRKTLYETQKPASGAVTSRPGQATAPLTAATRPPLGEEPTLELPPLSVPATEDTTPPVPPPAEAVQVDRELPPPVVSGSPVSLAEGIERFKVVEPQLAAGSLPSVAGWSFLLEKGYKTVLDLRPRDQAKPGEDAAASHAGLRYVILPMTPESLDEALVARFEDELAQAGNRPLYFFDTDGVRSAVLWRVHLLTHGSGDAEARAAVAEIGTIDDPWEQAIEKLLAARKPRSAAVEPTPTAAVEPLPAPVVPAALVPAPTGPVAAVEPTPESQPIPDPAAWHPYAAMLVTGLGVPLAFFGRTALGTVSRLRPSLPAPATRRLSLPPSSDA